ncbi:MAG: hypothetical protein EAZ42_01370 [Verrucomicrobia bacterium]|nr:MAG: hypothetical protein EAZ42_01370 [Verrucomicrobiota bacterium]
MGIYGSLGPLLPKNRYFQATRPIKKSYLFEIPKFSIAKNPKLLNFESETSILWPKKQWMERKP